MTPTILTTVGDKKREIDFDVFLEAHTRLADYYKSMGMKGDLLDVAIVEALPQALAQVLDHPTQH